MEREPARAILQLRSIREERQARLDSRALKGAEAPELFAAHLHRYAGGDDLNALQGAYDYARNLPYSHPDLAGSAYLAHPIRVACMAMEVADPWNVDTITIALLHNVLEVAHVTEAELALKFGSRIGTAIAHLTVDWSRISESDKVLYYQRLAGGPTETALVKVLDKLDNLFLLCLNPSSQVRESYLQDIEVFVIPLARRALPGIEGYLTTLVDDCRRIGFLEEAWTLD